VGRVVASGLSKAFEGVRVLEGFDLDVAAGELVTLLGASGCGKTTALRLLAGLERPDAGRIEIGGRVVADAADGTWAPPEARSVGMVFQSYAVWPHMTVLENVAYPLRVAGVPRRERDERAREMVRRVGLEGLEERRPNQLSGGQQQRVALARGLVREPEVLLLDEPLSNLDAGLRLRMRRDVRRIQRETGATAVYVTHDPAEALEISDRLLLLERGRVVAAGTPDEMRSHAFLRPEGPA
jgi:ABC-type Fe3+/spermidine/putrescine transport system ATPase subunit